MERWHQRFGHLHHQAIETAKSLTVNLDATDLEKQLNDDGCRVCQLGKAKQQISRRPQLRANTPLAKLHADVTGPISKAGDKRERYMLQVIDDFSSFQ